MGATSQNTDSTDPNSWATTVDVAGLSEWIRANRPIRLQRIGLLSRSGDTTKITWPEPMIRLATLGQFGTLGRLGNLVTRADASYEYPNPARVKKIAQGIRTSTRPHVGHITVGIAPDPEHVELEVIEAIGPGAAVARITIRESAPDMWLVDGYHRLAAIRDVWGDVQDATDAPAVTLRDTMAESAVEVTLVVDTDPDTLTDLFLTLASPDPSLRAVMDNSTTQNRLAQLVLRDALMCQPRSLHGPADPALTHALAIPVRVLYPAATIRSASAAIAGVGVQDRTPAQRETHLAAIIANKITKTGATPEEALNDLAAQVVADLDYAFTHLPGWREIAAGTLTPAQFTKQYLHSAPVGLYVIANTIAAARLAGIPTTQAIDALADIPWRRDAAQATHTTDNNGSRQVTGAHMFFEGTIARTGWDDRTGWYATIAGTRGDYEPAISRVLHYLGAQPGLAAIAGPEVFTALGLVGKRGRGRPRKNPPPAAG